jgi:hypothetical protein
VRRPARGLRREALQGLTGLLSGSAIVLPSLNHLVRPVQHRLRYRPTDLFYCLEINHLLEQFLSFLVRTSHRRICQHIYWPVKGAGSFSTMDLPGSFLMKTVKSNRHRPRTGFLSVKLNFVLAIPLICLPRTSNVCQDCQPEPARLAKPGRTTAHSNATSLQDRTTLLGIIFAEKGGQA